MVLVQTTGSIAVRFDAVRALSYATGFATRVMSRRTRGKDSDEPLGGAASPLVGIEGVGQVVLGPPVGTKLVAIALSADPFFVRESALVAIEGDATYENGRLPGGDGDSIPLLQIRGTGTVALVLPASVSSIEVTEGRASVVRAHAVLGWTGRIVPRSMAPSEAPARTRGLVELSGEGMVFLDGR
jgi:uncharacterized protein (AIM24 family)